MTQTAQSSRASGGFTLLEVLVSLVIIAFMSAGVTIGLKRVSRSDLRKTASMTASTIRWAFDYATINGLYVRMSFDSSTNHITLEETEDLVYLRDESTEEREEREQREKEELESLESSFSDTADGQAGDTPYNPFLLLSLGGGSGGEFDPQQIINEAQGAVEPPRRPKPSFEPIAGKKPYVINPKIRIDKVLKQGDLVDGNDDVSDDTDEEQKKHLYFFPQGQTEASIVVFSKGAYRYSILVHPLNGRAKVFACDIAKDADDTVEILATSTESPSCTRE